MKTFWLVRDEDETGISGTGVVAEGVKFLDGTTVLRWLQDGVAPEHQDRGVRPTTVVFESVEAVEALHGHGGKTRIVWSGALVGDQ